MIARVATSQNWKTKTKTITWISIGDQTNFPLCCLNSLCAKSSHNSTSQELTNCRSSESYKSNCDSPYSDFCPFLWEHVFSKFLTQLITYFQHICSSSMESIWPCNKKQGLMSVAFCSSIMITTYYVELNKTLCHWLSLMLLWSQHAMCN